MADDTRTEEQKLQDELEALQQSNAQLHARERTAQLRKAIDAERMLQLRAKIVDEIVSKALGANAREDIDYRFVAIDDQLVCVSKPHELQYRKFRDSEKTDIVSCIQFIRPSVLYPETKEAFAAMCSEYPAMADEAAGAGLYLCKVRAKAREGK